MVDLSSQVPLLSERKLGFKHPENRPILQILAKLVFKFLLWAIFIGWAATIFFFPTKFVKKLVRKWIEVTEEYVFGIAGSVFLGFSAPILAIAILAFVYMAIFPGENYGKNNYKFPRYRLRTFPVLVDGPFGVVSAAELIGIILFTVYVIWSVAAYALESHDLKESFSVTLKDESLMMLEHIGLRLGLIGLFCMVFLFLPVARGSILLRITDIPFEQAARYHVWLGHLTMAIFTLHGLAFIILWAVEGRLYQEIMEWSNIGIANLPGSISLFAGMLMWVTSLGPVRRSHFELFFYTHQLYVIFVVFLALHVGDFIFSFAAGAIFLFVIDRFLRFWQSRSTVDIISASCRPCGTVELVFSKPPRLQYNALSFIFLQVRQLSWLQWHPFSVSSSPLDGKHHLSVLIKALGEWTSQLRDIISNVSDHPQHDLQSKPKPFTVSVEGPYGHEIPYHLMYENLLLVAGGIGISPFLAILNDVRHLTSKGEYCLPKNIFVIWAVKKSKELSLLWTVDKDFVCSSFSSKLTLEIQAFVTQESEPPLEEGSFNEKRGHPSLLEPSNNSISCLVGTGHQAWAGAYVLVTTVGYIAFYALLESYYINPFQIDAWWYKGLLSILCMIASVVSFGGIFIFLWNRWEKKSLNNESWMATQDEKMSLFDHNVLPINGEKDYLTSVQITQYGSRPNFREIFGSFAQRVGHANIGVIVCGPRGLQSSVAKECRHQNMRRKWNHPIFHFNNHSFDL